MAEYTEDYKKKVRYIYERVDCSHHPQNAVDLIQKNDWSATKGITPNYFVEDHSFGIISAKTLEKLSPRERVAYEILRKNFLALPSLAYFGGRSIREGFSLPEDDSTLDNFVFDVASDHCAGMCMKLAYSKEYPLSSGLDKIVGFLAGVPLTPITFLAGLVYTPKKNPKLIEADE